MSEDIKLEEQKLNNPKITLEIQPNGRVIIPIEAFGMKLHYRGKDGENFEMMKKTIQGTLERPPQSLAQMYARATAADSITIESWKKQWLEYLEANAKTHDFKEWSAMCEFGKEKYKPVICAGSGPSLKKNYLELKNRGEIKIVSCLHNFGFFEENNIMNENDYYITLDAGDITLKEVSEGGEGKHPEEWYWERTKDRVLLAFVSTNPKLIAKWQGKIYWFIAPSSEKIMEDYTKKIDINVVPCFNVGGNVLGAGMYFARAILGAGILIFVGADFSFDYNHFFHGWNSNYDSQFSGVIPTTDIFGNRVYTWGSYWGFKIWFDWMANGGNGNNPQLWINATEGGIMGAYPEGNIKQIIQMDLKSTLYTFNMTNRQVELMKNTKDHPVLLF